MTDTSELCIIKYLNTLNIEKEELNKRKTIVKIEDDLWYILQMCGKTADSKQIKKVVKNWVAQK
jgi:hypothetical protein